MGAPQVEKPALTPEIIEGLNSGKVRECIEGMGSV